MQIARFEAISSGFRLNEQTRRHAKCPLCLRFFDIMSAQRKVAKSAKGSNPVCACRATADRRIEPYCQAFPAADASVPLKRPRIFSSGAPDGLLFAFALCLAGLINRRHGRGGDPFFAGIPQAFEQLLTKPRSRKFSAARSSFTIFKTAGTLETRKKRRHTIESAKARPPCRAAKVPHETPAPGFVEQCRTFVFKRGTGTPHRCPLFRLICACDGFAFRRSVPPAFRSGATHADAALVHRS